MTLFEINQELENAFESLVDPETGEILDGAYVLDALTMERNEKIENIYNKKSRLKSRVQNSDSPRREEYLSLIR